MKSFEREQVGVEPLKAGTHDKFLRAKPDPFSSDSQAALRALSCARIAPGDEVMIVGENAEHLMHQLARDMDCVFEVTLVSPLKTRKFNQKSIDDARWVPRKKWAFSSDSIDLVICTQDFETLNSPKFVFDEILRVTKPGGSICLVLGGASYKLSDPELQGSCFSKMFYESEARRVIRTSYSSQTDAFLIRK